MMERNLFRRFADIAYQRAGIQLKEGKESLVSARVAKRLRALAMDDYREYLDFLENDSTGEELVAFLDVISTNFTNFFREPDHFQALREELDAALKTGQRRLRIWSAASSSGEEPYSIAITLADALESEGNVDARILATDISTKVLDLARRGQYGAARVGPLSKAQLNKYFVRHGRRGAENCEYEAKSVLKNLLTFRRLNLAQPPFPMKGPLDAVFCRNVMIYFDNRVRQGLITEIERLLKPGGILFIGHSETLAGIRTGLSALRPSVYRAPNG